MRQNSVTAMNRSLLVLSTIGLLWSTFAHARYAEPQHGKEILQKLCAQCHAVGRTGASPNRLAPPFRTFSETKLYDSDFMQRLQDGYSSIHPFMPTFRFNRDDAEEVPQLHEVNSSTTQAEITSSSRHGSADKFSVTGNGYGLQGVPSCCRL